MMKLMIVDDEAIIRSGLKTIIDWDAMGIELVAEVGNGRDALDRALILRPDIVLTDIKMPIVDGVEFARKLLEKRPETRIVFLTGYSDFEYMQKAVKLGVEDYLLKPVNVEELETLFRRICSNIVEERKNKQRNNSVIQLITKNNPVLRGNCFQQFINQKFSVQTFLEEAIPLDIPLHGPKYVVVVIDIDDYQRISKQEKNNYHLRYAVLNIAEESFMPVGKTAFGYLSLESRMLGIINIEEGGLEFVKETCKQIQFFIQQFLNFTVTIAISLDVSEFSDLYHACHEACNTLNQKIYAGKNQVYMAEDYIPYPQQKLILLKKQDEIALREAFSIRNILLVQKKLDEIFKTYLSEEKYCDKSIKYFAFTLFMLALHILEEENITQEMAFGSNNRITEELSGYETVSEIQMYMKNIYYRTMQAIEGNSITGSSKLIREAMKYVQQNYMNSVKVMDVAAAVFVTPNYFSKIFKNEVGESFTEWLNRFRVEKSKELMKNQSEEKIYEIAMSVGFTDYKYFSFIFKKYTGYTPVTYKKLLH